MIFVQLLNRFINADFCRAFDNDPMLCTMKVGLKGQGGFGLYVSPYQISSLSINLVLSPLFLVSDF
jgi:hypothetical protein